MGDVRFPWYSRKYTRYPSLTSQSTMLPPTPSCRGRTDLVDTSKWIPLTDIESQEEMAVKRRKTFKQVASTIKTRSLYHSHSNGEIKGSQQICCATINS